MLASSRLNSAVASLVALAPPPPLDRVVRGVSVVAVGGGEAVVLVTSPASVVVAVCVAVEADGAGMMLAVVVCPFDVLPGVVIDEMVATVVVMVVAVTAVVVAAVVLAVVVVGTFSQFSPVWPLIHLHVHCPVLPVAEPEFLQGCPLAPAVQPPATLQSTPPHPAAQSQL